MSDGSPRSSRSAGPRLTATDRSNPSRRRSPISSSARSSTNAVSERPSPEWSASGRKSRRHQQPAARVRPAHERLDAAHLARRDLGLRLVVQDELAAREPVAQLAQQLEPAAAVVVALGQVDLVAGARALGLVHRDVGALEQAERVVRVLREERDADAGVDVHPDPADAERALQRRPQPQAGGARRGLVTRGEHDGELVAAEPRQRVALAQRHLQPRPDLAQHLVAGVVAERVVELLEAVEVDQQQRDLGVGVLDRLAEPREQVPAVPQPGQVVGDRGPLALAQAVDDRQAGAGHPGQHGDRRQRGGGRRQADELPDDEQRQRR